VTIWLSIIYNTAFWNICRTTATTKPNAVVSRATEIPPATTALLHAIKDSDKV
jgi:hypothetical protein